MIQQWQTDLIEEAESWIGTPFNYGCAEKGKGIDCARFLVMTFKAFGYIRPGHQIKHLPPDWFMATEKEAREYEKIFVGELYNLADEVPNKERRITDILLMEYYGFKSHVGMLMPETRMIHARNQRKVQVQNIGNFESRICSVWRFKGLPE